jgi:hypothetical protein
MKNLKKILRPILIALATITAIALLFTMRKYSTKEEVAPYTPNNVDEVLSNIAVKKFLSPYDATYNIWGQETTLRNKESRVAISPGSSVEIVTKYFGNDIKYDLDHDGRNDTIFMLTQETGSSGIFYYVVALIDTEKGRLGLDGVYVGDRIAPQSMYMEAGEILVINFAERKIGQSFAEQPTVGRTIKVKYDPDTMQFAEVVQN